MPELPSNQRRRVKTTKSKQKIRPAVPQHTLDLTPFSDPQPPPPKAPESRSLDLSALHTVVEIQRAESEGDSSSAPELDDEVSIGRQEVEQPALTPPTTGPPRQRRIYRDDSSSKHSSSDPDTSDSDDRAKWEWVRQELQRRAIPAIPVHVDDIVVESVPVSGPAGDTAAAAARTELMESKPYRKLTFATKKLVKKLTSE